MGVQIDKRMGELGGTRLQNLVCADEGTGLEETVEKFKNDVTVAVKSLLAASKGGCGEEDSSEAASDESKAEVSFFSSSLHRQNNFYFKDHLHDRS
jgi:ribosomal protein L12E/L44/L45/RPP1/RPP2